MDQGRGCRGRGKHSDGQRGGRSGGNRGRCCQQWRPLSASSTSTSTSTSTTRQTETDHVRGNRPGERSGESRNWKDTSTLAGETSWRPIKVNNRTDGFDEQVSSTSEPASARNQENLRVPGIEAPTAPFATQGKILPIRRPDEGGKSAIQLSALHVNHFPVRFDPNTLIYHYNVDVQPEVPSENDMDKKISKSNLSMIRNKLFSEHLTEFPVSMTAYDGEKNIFSVVRLTEGKYSVKISEGEDAKISTYMTSLSLVKTFKFCRLRDYICKQVLSLPREVLQTMDVVMKENPTKEMISFGRKFFSKDELKAKNIGNGLTALWGTEQGLMATSQGLVLRLDYSVLAFRKKMPVIDFLKEHIPKFELNQFSEFRDRIEEALQGLKVTVTHRRTNQKYTICRLSDKNVRFISFYMEDEPLLGPPRDITLVDYFKGKYGKEIVYKDIPCLDLGRGGHSKYVPMEFCVLVEGQKYPKEQLNKNAILILRSMSLAKAHERKKIINEMVKSPDGPCGGKVVHNFGMEVEKRMTRVTGRVIGPPELKLGNPDAASQFTKIEVEPPKFQWNLVGKSVVEGKQVDRWTLLDFSKHDKFYRLDFERFKQNLLKRSRKMGINMAPPIEYKALPMKALTDIRSLKQELEKIANKYYKGRLQLILCVLPKKDPGYKYLKWISETQVGVVTQCCLSKTANEGNDQYFANLCLKINAKLGGSNVELLNSLPPFEGKGHVMFIGADVNHPASRNTTGPSIAAVVGTVNWPAANRYAARVRSQDHRKEQIVNFGDICWELVESYAKVNTLRPEMIVVFRDGVSEGQFDMVLNEELVDLKDVFQSKHYFPTITLIVAQKRHQTRLFQEEGKHTVNVYPGTVVDTTIVHPFEFDFYLCSHYGSLGTSKPTHYHVLWDEHGFSSDSLQKLIYQMCFTFARCTKPVSLVPPVYYADLAAYRGRLYYEAMMDGDMLSPSQVSLSSPSSASLSLTSPASLDEGSYRLHSDLVNSMFFT